MKSKVRIDINFIDAKESVVSNLPPINIEINQNTLVSPNFPSHVPAPNYSCGKYRITGIGINSNSLLSYDAEVAYLTKWNSGNNQEFDAADWIECDGSYRYFAQLVGQDARAGTMTITKLEDCTCYRCKISISDTSGEIYSKAYPCPIKYLISCDDRCPAGQERIPTIEYPGYKCREKCPPETCCECDCGEVICCYGSNGQVLKTIPK